MKLFKNIGAGMKAVGLWTKKHWPDIAFGGGMVGVPVATVIACKATLKLDDILDEAKAEVEAIHAKYGAEVESKESRKEISKAYWKYARKIAKLYAPAAGLEACSIGLLVSSHVQMKKQNAALVAAYAALNETFKEYRERVKKLVGSDQEKDIRYNADTQQDEQGNVRKRSIPSNSVGLYSRFFGPGNPNFDDRNFDQNILFLKLAQNKLTNRLHEEGFLYLNEAYEAIGLPRTEDGQWIGWVDGVGDSYVDFGMYSETDTLKQQFINGEIESILLDFNVDGDISFYWEKQRSLRPHGLARLARVHDDGTENIDFIGG